MPGHRKRLHLCFSEAIAGAHWLHMSKTHVPVTCLREIWSTTSARPVCERALKCRVKIPARYTPIAFAFFMSMLMAFLMSAVLTLVNLGAVPDFLMKWMRAFAIAWCCAFPAVLLVSPIARKLVATFVDAGQASK